jgi:DNA-directed RNA polymerase specialized sigma24 family protein
MDRVQQQWEQALQRMRNHLFARDIEPLREPLLGYCLRLTGDAAAAEDLQQETLIRGLALCRICGGPDDTRAYLFRSAANLWIDHLRRRKKEAGLQQRLALLAPPSPFGALGAEWLDFLAHTLTPREFEVFVLRELHGYGAADTARRLGATEAAVKMAATRARQRLRAATGLSQPLRGGTSSAAPEATCAAELPRVRRVLARSAPNAPRLIE